MLGLSLLFSIYGTFYIAFAFREPPEALARFFKVEVPLLFGLVLLLLPDRIVMKAGRVTIGAIFLVASAFFFIFFLRDVSSALTAWIGLPVKGTL